ncbi:MAG: hypothetical protein J6U62_00310, partial [Bacteroidaceae bacterium]|nr:hypothetical protein [Bacteroidaceae bacterium]
MRNIYKIILLALPMAMTLLSCSAIKKTFWGPKDVAEDEIADETIVIEFPEGIATETEYVIDIEDVECDSCLFEVPESMT